MKNLKEPFFLCLFAVAFFAGCGYQFEGGGYIKNDVTIVAVKVLKNKSSETGAALSFTNALIEQIIQNTNARVGSEASATAVIEGTINAINFTTLTRSTSQSVIDRRVSAIVDLKLTKKDGEIIWSVKNFTTHEEYTVSKDKITDEISKKEAVDKIAIRNAERLISQMLNNF